MADPQQSTKIEGNKKYMYSCIRHLFIGEDCDCLAVAEAFQTRNIFIKRFIPLRYMRSFGSIIIDHFFFFLKRRMEVRVSCLA